MSTGIPYPSPVAISFSRPDPSSPAAVAGASFPTSRRGFEPTEVRDFLRMVAAELSRLQERERFLEREVANRPEGAPFIPADLDDDTITEMLGEETARIIQAAREAAGKIRARAEETAQRLLRDATEDAARIREEAELEAARRRQDATADAEAEVLMAKQQGRDMVEEARAYRERVLADVARRRELAREQIEDLIHGRDRLVQSFERARIATDDVLRDLADAGDEPSEFVNLANTTGPVPIVVQADEMHESMRRPMPTQFYDQDRDEAETVVHEQVVVRHPSIDNPTASMTVAEMEEVHAVVVDTPVVVEEIEVVEEAVAIETPEPVVEPVVEAPKPSNVVPLFGKSEPAPTEPAKPAARTAVPVDDIFAKLRRASAESVAKEANSKTKAVTPSPKLDDVADSVTTFESRDEILVPLVLTMGRKIKRVLADEQNEVLDILRGRAVVKTLDAIVGPKSDHTKRFCSALSASVKSAAIAGARSIHTTGSVPSDKALAEMVAPQLKAVDEAIITAFVEPLRERLSRSISQAGGSNAELSSLVRSVYREWKNQIVDEHIDDIAYTAFGRGALSALDPDMKVCWKFDPAGPGCPDAEDNSLAGAICGGDAFPTGHTHAPAHAGCRCALVPLRN
ncbi:MAG: hypothetical protein B7C54_05330 [Acidimicrobiales bacterium mtb01]|nr:hypothetical protein [Actinomycetota bacterium]TEX46627.1 MAG: hypothetical protein B7C54_05330 [Acidimicrobiales bacterium mtb01]